MNATPSDVRQFHDHSRHWRDFRYVYPVISRRARGLSIGINLNPDKRCNWNCVYCQVDRTAAPVVEHIDEQRLFDELTCVVGDATTGTLWREPSFVSTPHGLRLMRDFALSGDGEPTSYPRFAEILDRLLRFRKACGFERLPVTLFTNATLLHLSRVQAGLALLSNATGRVWCKLDAGTESSFQRVNASRYSLEHCLNNIAALGRQRPIEIQSMFMVYDGAPPPD
ncbi:MAG: radical SAM protein, partial [Planctomycetes bacterium]|nr:radical SAM protein [Planctomycetota bacterium]